MADRLSWLDEAMRTGRCPLCCTAATYESGALARLCDEFGSGGGAVVDTFVAARGLCPAHTAALVDLAGQRHETDALLRAYLTILDGLARDLAELEQDEWLARPQCPLCVERNRLVVLSAHRLLDDLAHEPARATGALIDAGGLCLEHFTVCWESTPDEVDRAGVREAELAATGALTATIRELLHSVAHTDDGRRDDVTRRAAALLPGSPPDHVRRTR